MLTGTQGSDLEEAAMNPRKQLSLDVQWVIHTVGESSKDMPTQISGTVWARTDKAEKSRGNETSPCGSREVTGPLRQRL